MKRIILSIAIISVAASLTIPGVQAKDAASTGNQFYPELQGDADMQGSTTRKIMTKSGVQYGAWITPAIIYQETPNNLVASTAITSRIWMKSYLWENSYIYLRGKDTYQVVMHQTRHHLLKDSNVIDLDVGFIDISNNTKNINFSIGRKYFIVGSGLVFSGRGDGAEFNFYSPYINIKAFGTYTGLMLKDDNPYGLSDKDIASGSRRVFAGGSLWWEFYNQKLSLFGMAQIDFGREHFNDTRRFMAYLGGYDGGFRFYSQRTHYNSQYWGAGLEGNIIANLSYQGEFIFETGRSPQGGMNMPTSTGQLNPFTSQLGGANVLTNIRAFAGTFKLSYFFKVILKPALVANYAFGSGDSNRNDYRSPTSNMYGQDQGFLYFGTFVGGYGLRPLLSNMHVISGGLAFSPFSWVNNFSVKTITIIANYFYYLKNKNAATINYGSDATRPKRHIGQGVDLAFRWLIVSDLSFFANYGIFIPGRAFGFGYDYRISNITYSSKAYRHFIMGGFNINF